VCVQSGAGEEEFNPIAEEKGACRRSMPDPKKKNILKEKRGGTVRKREREFFGSERRGSTLMTQSATDKARREEGRVISAEKMQASALTERGNLALIVASIRDVGKGQTPACKGSNLEKQKSRDLQRKNS